MAPDSNGSHCPDGQAASIELTITLDQSVWAAQHAGSFSNEGGSLHILLVAPDAPPKNSPEAMQVGRFLSALDPEVRVTLVTTPTSHGRSRVDPSLAIHRPGMRTIMLALPFHRVTQRVLSHRWFKRLRIPDDIFWLPWMAKSIVRRMGDVPDVIYSRSYPTSSALLAKRLKYLFHRPWMMHLSDPWVDNPYRRIPDRLAAAERLLEADCFRDADLISLTTEGQARHYRLRYPHRAKSIALTPNMMPGSPSTSSFERSGTTSPVLRTLPQVRLNLIHAGSLYGSRRPHGLLGALALLRMRTPKLSLHIRVHFIGNMSSQLAQLVDASPECERYGSITFSDAMRAQAEADILVSIEPSETDPLFNHFLLSKVVDYLWSDKPILALTPDSSITAAFCRSGYGWSFTPDDVAGITGLLEKMLTRPDASANVSRPRPPKELDYMIVTKGIERNLQRLSNLDSMEEWSSHAR